MNEKKCNKRYDEVEKFLYEKKIFFWQLMLGGDSESTDK